jgi:hypothetical protein
MDSLYVSTKSNQSSSIILPRTWRGIKRLLKSNPLYMLLVFVPVGVSSGILDRSPIAVFVFNMLAIVPLAMLLNFATEELSANAGQTVGALLNATFGNAVEMIVSDYERARPHYHIPQFSQCGFIRLVPWPCSAVKSASSKLACLARSCPTFSW